MTIHIVVILISLIPLGRVSETKLPAFLEKFKKPVNCGQYTAQLTALLILMCNNIAATREDDAMARDACIGCFQQASSTAANNQPSLTNLRDCAENYLGDSRYDECSSQIDSNPGNAECVTGYCRFVSCIRRVNSDLLIAECYQEASANNDAVSEEDQVMLVKNITSCILARTRCASINPITGQQQTSTLTATTYDKWGKPRSSTIPLFNSLQITPEGDLRIIRLPGTTKIQNYFCTAQPNLRESSWLGYSC